MELAILRSLVAGLLAAVLALWLVRRYSKVQGWYWDRKGVYQVSSHVYASLTLLLCWCLGLGALWGVMWIFTYTL